jgi:hypothetical protein
MLYVPRLDPRICHLEQVVALLAIADKLSMPDLEQAVRNSVINVPNCGLAASSDSFLDLLAYAARQNDPTFAKSVIMCLRPFEHTVESMLMRPSIERFDSVPPRYMTALWRSVVKLGRSATWAQIAKDFDVADGATAPTPQGTKRSAPGDPEPDVGPAKSHYIGIARPAASKVSRSVNSAARGAGRGPK